MTGAISPVRAWLLSVALLAAFTFVVADTLIGLYEERSAEISLLERKQAAQAAMLERASALEQRHALLTRLDETRDAALPAGTAAAVAVIQQRLRSAADEAGVVIETVDIPPAESGERFTSIRLKARFAAPIEALRSLMATIERGVPALRVEALGINAKPGNARFLDIDITILGLSPRSAG